jgi:hypothetical protein
MDGLLLACLRATIFLRELFGALCLASCRGCPSGLSTEFIRCRVSAMHLVYYCAK